MDSLYELTRAGLDNFFNLNLEKVRYEDIGLSSVLGGIVCCFILIRLIIFLFGRRKHSSMYPGHLIYRNHGNGFLKKMIFAALYAVFTAAAIGCLAALANPYLLGLGEEKKVIEARERMDFIDLSVSMGWPYENSEISLAEFVRSRYLKFLNSRKNSNDRVAIWTFSESPYLIEDFTDDSEFYILQASDAPLVLADPNHLHLLNSKNDPNNIFLDVMVTSENGLRLVAGEGGTDMADALDAGIKYFDRYGSKGSRSRAIMMVTDLAADKFPDRELRELQKRKIRPYVIYIANTNYGKRVFNDGGRKENAEKLKKPFPVTGASILTLRIGAVWITLIE